MSILGRWWKRNKSSTEKTAKQVELIRKARDLWISITKQKDAGFPDALVLNRGPERLTEEELVRVLTEIDKLLDETGIARAHGGINEPAVHQETPQVAQLRQDIIKMHDYFDTVKQLLLLFLRRGVDLSPLEKSDTSNEAKSPGFSNTMGSVLLNIGNKLADLEGAAERVYKDLEDIPDA